MDETAFAELVKRLRAVDQVIKELDPSLRATAIEAFAGYLSEGQEIRTSAPSNRADAEDASDESSSDSIFIKFSHDKPFENTRLVAAYFYSKYGLQPFTVDELRSKADDAGLTIPTRLDMTLVQAKEQGKSLFSRAGKGAFKPTVHGEQYFRDNYKVVKGKKPKVGATTA